MLAYQAMFIKIALMTTDILYHKDRRDHKDDVTTRLRPVGYAMARKKPQTRKEDIWAGWPQFRPLYFNCLPAVATKSEGWVGSCLDYSDSKPWKQVLIRFPDHGLVRAKLQAKTGPDDGIGRMWRWGKVAALER